ncbi:10555_t:CDS:2, partial [Racocetra fulgida]
RRRRTGVQYFDQFRTHFWKRPEDEFDRIHLGNITPALSIEEVEHELGQTLPGNRRSRRNSVDSRRSRRRSASPSRDTINTNTNNPDAMNPETSTLQPPPYGADEAQNISLRLAHANFPEMNQSHVVSSHKVANSGNNLTPNLLNMSLSQNESDVSMHDV